MCLKNNHFKVMNSEIVEIFKEYPESSKVWIFTANKEIEGNTVTQLSDYLSTFVDDWKRHGKKIDASYHILWKKFVIIVSTEKEVEASGCSQDAVLHFMQDEIAGLKFSPPNTICYKDENHILQMSHTEFIKNIKRKRVFTPETEVFDTSIYKVTDLQRGLFVKTLKDSWHHEIFQKNQ